MNLSGVFVLLLYPRRSCSRVVEHQWAHGTSWNRRFVSVHTSISALAKVFEHLPVVFVALYQVMHLELRLQYLRTAADSVVSWRLLVSPNVQGQDHLIGQRRLPIPC